MKIKLFEEFNEPNWYNLESLKSYLNKFSIPIDRWGTGKSKTVEHLQDELINSECTLTEKDGLLIRNIEFVGVKVFYSKDGEQWSLKEDRQEFKDGRIRRRNMLASVSEKMKFGEDPLIASIRGVKEELGIEIRAHQLSKRRDLNYDGGSMSYPGLKTIYIGHQFTCNLDDEQFDPKGYIEVQKDKNTFFTWVKL